VQKCQKCSEPFRLKSIIKSWFFGYKFIKCSSCNSEHYVSRITRIGYSTFAITIPMIFVLVLISTKAINIYNIFWEYLLAHLLWITLITLVLPFFARYHIREDADLGNTQNVIRNRTRKTARPCADVLEKGFEE